MLRVPCPQQTVPDTIQDRPYLSVMLLGRSLPSDSLTRLSQHRLSSRESIFFIASLRVGCLAFDGILSEIRGFRAPNECGDHPPIFRNNFLVRLSPTNILRA